MSREASSASGADVAPLLPPPAIPWQVTGNHSLTLPCIHPVDAGIHLIGAVHARSRSALELTGGEHAAPDGEPLARVVLRIDGKEYPLGGDGMVWERELAWLPTFSCVVADLAIRGTIFAPHGAAADFAAVIIALTVENRSGAARELGAGLSGVAGRGWLRVRRPRPLHEPSRVSALGDAVVVEAGDAAVGLTLGVSVAEGAGHVELGESGRWSVSRSMQIDAGGKSETGFVISAGSEPDGALAKLATLRHRGWRSLLDSTRAELRKMQQATGSAAADRLINRNLAFAYFTGVARAIDDDRVYVVRSRMPWNGRGLTIRDWEALAWILPAVQLADADLAREIILRTCELHGHSPGRGVNYIDGTLFQAGFSLEGACSYAIATDEYIVQTGDDRLVDEPALAETLYASFEDIEARRHRELPLFSTEVDPEGGLAALPYTAHGNAVAAFAMEVLSRMLDEKTAASVQEPETVRAALMRHFSAVAADGRARFVSSSDLAGSVSGADNPSYSLYWLPYYHAVGRDDSLYRRTVKQWDGAQPERLLEACARLVGPSSSAMLEWLRRAPLDGGVAAEVLDSEGKAVGNGGDAALSGLLAYMAWYSVHALGAKV